MKKLGLLLFVLTNITFGKILEINVGTGVRNINQEINLYYIKKSSLISAKVKPTKVKFDKKNTSFIYGKLDIPLMPAIEFKYLEYTLHAFLSSSLSFYFGNIQIEDTKADINLDQNTKELNLDIYYSLPFLNFLKLGAGTNILDVNLKAQAKFENGTSQEENYNFTLPILYIYSSLNFDINKFIFNVNFRYLPKVNIEDYNIEYLSISPQIGYKILSLPTINFITYSNYEYSNLKIIKESNSSDKFYFEKKNSNFEIGGFLNLGF
ncbi:MAG TPA: hypothetical protein EYH39_00095 [Desulfurobacteriaceae bacterium]|nr:hypothetical protein [Desulfurobacteriaceae bacterium]